ncbi:type II toxin-antitoxin system antitoxin SocA domain-containing protein [Micrococcus luteus]|uniref:type II toxin-antitoxin system antitoxin SocA domain-containing protein n=1 Tax=Micrococcus luteus TaxID=1270 RepID=UPI0015D912B4|nr:type II toxin-antitoxin system antitoxin SocA domain-containing protein [Micrococcus luteus]
MSKELQPYDGARRSVLAVLAAARARGYKITRTKLVKLVYLADLKYFERYRITTSGFAWSWHNFGPFDMELGTLENAMRADGSLKSTVSTVDGYYGPYAETRYETPLTDAQIVSSIDEEFWTIVQTIVGEFGGMGSKDLERYTYTTAPMVEIQEEGKRGDILNLGAGRKSRTLRGASLSRFREAAERLSNQKDCGDMSDIGREIQAWTPLRARANREVLDA